MFSLNGTLKKNGSVGRWETKQFIGMALMVFRNIGLPELSGKARNQTATKEIASCYCLPIKSCSKMYKLVSRDSPKNFWEQSHLSKRIKTTKNFV